MFPCSYNQSSVRALDTDFLQVIRAELPFDAPFGLIVAGYVPKILDYMKEFFSEGQIDPKPASELQLLPFLPTERFLAIALHARKVKNREGIQELKRELNVVISMCEAKDRKKYTLRIQSIFSAFKCSPKKNAMSFPVLQFQLYIASQLGNDDAVLMLLESIAKLTSQKILKEPFSTTKEEEVLDGKYKLTVDAIYSIGLGIGARSIIRYTPPAVPERYVDEEGDEFSSEELHRRYPRLVQAQIFIVNYE